MGTSVEIGAFAEGRVSVRDKRVVDAAGRPIAGYDLTDEIEGIVAQAEG